LRPSRATDSVLLQCLVAVLMLTEAFLWPAVASKRAAGPDPDAGSFEAH